MTKVPVDTSYLKHDRFLIMLKYLIRCNEAVKVKCSYRQLVMSTTQSTILRYVILQI